jgi:SAM-dependent methyltransferase
VANLEFTTGDVYALDYEASTFDVVHAHQVLQHLSDPVAALREMGRVCKPEGLVAVRDSDYSGFTWWPAVPELDEWLGLYREVARGNDAEPDAGRRLKSWALAAELDVVSSTAGVWCFSSPDDVAWWGGMWAERVVGSAMADQAMERGLASAEDLGRLAQGWRRWAASPDAWFAVLHGELLCTGAAVA